MSKKQKKKLDEEMKKLKVVCKEGHKMVWVTDPYENSSTRCDGCRKKIGGDACFHCPECRKKGNGGWDYCCACGP